MEARPSIDAFIRMAKKGSLFNNFKQFDGYAKTLDDFRVKTTTGASGNNTSASFLQMSSILIE